ncbi:MAG: acyltransferase [Nostoc sp.]
MKLLRNLDKIIRLKLFSRANITLNSLEIIVSRTAEFNADLSSLIIFNKNIFIGRYVFIDIYENTLFELGNQVHIGDFSIIRGTKCEIIIGDNTMIAPRVQLLATNHRYINKNKLIVSQDIDTDKNGIWIGKDCWIGAGATILPGVKIGDGAVVGAMAVVTKDVASYSVVVGNPATTINMRI